MFSIGKNQQIFLTRGDTATIKTSVYDIDGYPYTLQSTDVLRLTVKQTENSASAVLTKTADSQGYFIIAAADTASMTPGLYQYDIQLFVDSEVYTIIAPSFFEIGAEIGGSN